MAKQVKTTLKLQIQAGKANLAPSSPPSGLLLRNLSVSYVPWLKPTGPIFLHGETPVSPTPFPGAGF